MTYKSESDRTIGSWELVSEDIVIEEVDMSWGSEGLPEHFSEDVNQNLTENIENVDHETVTGKKKSKIKTKSLRRNLRIRKTKQKIHGTPIDLNKDEIQNDRRFFDKIREEGGKLICIQCNRLKISRFNIKQARAHAIQCGEGSKRKAVMKSKTVLCTMCDETFDSLVKKNKHHDRVHNALVYKCSKCDKLFKRREHLVRHIIVKHTTQEKPHKCKNCTKMFHSKYNMKTHEQGCQNKLPTKITRTMPKPSEQGLQDIVIEKKMGTAWENVIYITHNNRLDLFMVSESGKLKIVTSHDIPFTLSQVRSLKK